MVVESSDTFKTGKTALLVWQRLKLVLSVITTVTFNIHNASYLHFRQTFERIDFGNIKSQDGQGLYFVLHFSQTTPPMESK